MGVTSFAYKLVLLLHILSAIIGFGGVLLNGLYASRAKKRPPAEALAVVEDNAWVSMKVAEVFIYLTAVFGLGLVGLSDKLWKFSQTWVWLSVLIYVLALGLSHGVLFPTAKRMGVLMHEMAAGPPPVGGPPPQAAEMEQLGKKMGVVGPILNLALIVILFLMVWKPGL